MSEYAEIIIRWDNSPARYCRHCKAVLVRRDGEHPAEFLKRQHCNTTCSARASVAAVAEQSLGNCLYCQTPLKGRQRKFCSPEHARIYWSSCFPKTAEAK